MSCRPRSFVLRVLLLAVALVVAQWLLVQHEVQIDAHAAHAACEWCLTHSPLTGALPGAAPELPPSPVTFAPVAADYSFAACSVPPFYASRAPPFSPRS